MNVPRIGWSVVLLLVLLMFLGCGPSERERTTDAYNEQQAIDAFNRGVDHTEKGEFGKAIADHTEAIRLNPTFAEAYHNRGVAYSFSGQYDSAWADPEACRRLGGEVHPGFLAELRKASGREK